MRETELAMQPKVETRASPGLINLRCSLHQRAALRHCAPPLCPCTTHQPHKPTLLQLLNEHRNIALPRSVLLQSLKCKGHGCGAHTGRQCKRLWSCACGILRGIARVYGAEATVHREVTVTMQVKSLPCRGGVLLVIAAYRQSTVENWFQMNLPRQAFYLRLVI